MVLSIRELQPASVFNLQKRSESSFRSHLHARSTPRRLCSCAMRHPGRAALLGACALLAALFFLRDQTVGARAATSVPAFIHDMSRLFDDSSSTWRQLAEWQAVTASLLLLLPREGSALPVAPLPLLLWSALPRAHGACSADPTCPLHASDVLHRCHIQGLGTHYYDFNPPNAEGKRQDFPSQGLYRVAKVTKDVSTCCFQHSTSHHPAPVPDPNPHLSHHHYHNTTTTITTDA